MHDKRFNGGVELIATRLRALCALLFVVSAAPAFAQVEELIPLTSMPQSAAAMINETSQLWFVELTSPPTADGGSLANARSEKAAFRANARAVGLQYNERFAYDTLFNGLSIAIAPAELGKLSRIAGVKAVYPVVTSSVPRLELAHPDLATALAMTGADFVQNSLGYNGAGIRVGVMDTGIDYHHPDLGGCFGAGCRVGVGHDFVGDAFNADPASPAYNPVPTPDPFPDDCNGHGTHVAGIVGANGAVKGVAPGVTFGAYRVFGCDGSTTADIMIAAMERALADGMHVLNMSIGSSFQWPQYPTARAADRLVNKGIAVVASIGNSGANGLYSSGAPGNGKKVIGVASFDNSHFSLATFTVTPANIAAGYANASGAPAAPTTGSLLLAKTGTPTTTNDACAPLPLGSLAGKAVLIRRGTCTFHLKALNAQSAGAAAVVLYNNAAGRFTGTVAGTPAITIPVVTISNTEGVAINDAIVLGAQTLNWTTNVGSFVNPSGSLISAFSSYGLAPDLSLNPDIGAPGGFIRATYPVELGSYATISGTSMSSPHVAGSVALMLQAKPHTSSNAMRSILQNTAQPKPWFGNPGLGFLDNVHRQGAGMLQIDSAILATTKVEPGKLELGESQAGPATHTLKITNEGSGAVTYDISHVPALSTGPNTFVPQFFTGFAAVAFSAPSVVVPAGGSASVDVTITANAGLADKSQYGGYIVLTPVGGGQIYRVPYAGFKGDYQTIQVLTPTPAGFPWLAKLVGPSFFNQPGGATYTLVSDDVPFFLVHFDHQSRMFRAEVFDANTGKAWHRAFQFDYLGRNATATGFFALAWDGITTSGNKVHTVPDGQYVMKLSVLKALGDDNNPAHWETWTSPVITIDRP
ncbi:MAG TPA: S8 family serine peptidase [Casimicrobiaceae bacterium]|nr:S8 family serine peptidase [Casimicrobiaceae bacterium]